jgi:hypothetical protein
MKIYRAVFLRKIITEKLDIQTGFFIIHANQQLGFAASAAWKAAEAMFWFCRF